MKLERNNKFEYFHPEQKAIYIIPENVILDTTPILKTIKEKKMNDGGSAFMKH